MSKKIIVAGGGHGGIAAAAILAEKGFDVTVYEKQNEGTLGYDWTDIFAPGALKIAGIPMPTNDKFEYKTDMTFVSPNAKHKLYQHIDEDNREIKMERRDIYTLLINHAVGKGVKFVYGCTVNSPIMTGNRVVGISTDKGDFYADLIIDAAGVNSPVRTKLPAFCGIQGEISGNDMIHIYRAFFNKATDEEVRNKYKVRLFPDNRLGVAWVATEDEYSDLLIGRFSPMTEEEKNTTADLLRLDNPVLGTEVKRGGQFVKIPVRRPLSKLVCDGYAAIGDSAFMTVPIIGSGIANSLKAARILADAVISDANGEFSSETLWKYQYDFYKKIGIDLAIISCAKAALTQLTSDEINYLFEAGILTDSDISMGADATKISSILKFNPSDMKNKIEKVCKNKPVLKKISAVLAKGGKMIAVTSAIPHEWDSRKVRKWASNYDGIFGQY